MQFNMPAVMLLLCSMGIWKNKVVAVYLEDINVLYVNDTYIDPDTFDVSINYKPNSQNSLNAYIDAIKDADKDIIVHLIVSVRTMGYEIPLAGMGLTHSLCADDSVAKNIFKQIAEPFGINECPPKKGVYSVEDHSPDFSKGSFITTGTRFSLDFTITAEEEKIVQLKAFIEA